MIYTGSLLHQELHPILSKTIWDFTNETHKIQTHKIFLHNI